MKPELCFIQFLMPSLDKLRMNGMFDKLRMNGMTEESGTSHRKRFFALPFDKLRTALRMT